MCEFCGCISGKGMKRSRGERTIPESLKGIRIVSAAAFRQVKRSDGQRRHSRDNPPSAPLGRAIPHSSVVS